MHEVVDVLRAGAAAVVAVVLLLVVAGQCDVPPMPAVLAADSEGIAP